MSGNCGNSRFISSAQEGPHRDLDALVRRHLAHPYRRPVLDYNRAAFAAALAAGATPLKTPEKVFWGGYSGYWADLDGHAWEVAMNPFWPLAEDGSLTLP